MAHRTIAAALGAAGLLACVHVSDAAEIRVLASNAIKEAYLELVPVFERTSEHKVTTVWAGTVDIKKRLAAGETFDLVIMAAPAIDELIQQGKVVAGSRVDLAKSGIGVAVRTGAPKPDISSGDAVKRALLAAKSIGYSSGPSGVYLSDLFQRMGIGEQIKSKVKQTPPGLPVGTIIARGEAEIGFQQVSELLPVAGIDYLGPLPADIQHVTVFSGGIHVGAKEAEAARAWVKFITSPQAAPVVRKSGMEPG